MTLLDFGWALGWLASISIQVSGVKIPEFMLLGGPMASRDVAKYLAIFGKGLAESELTKNIWSMQIYLAGFYPQWNDQLYK